MQSHFHIIKHLTKVKLPSLPWTVPLNVAILRLADEAQSLQVPVNQGMAPGARLVVVDVEKSNDPGVYKAWGFGKGHLVKKNEDLAADDRRVFSPCVYFWIVFFECPRVGL